MFTHKDIHETSSKIQTQLFTAGGTPYKQNTLQRTQVAQAVPVASVSMSAVPSSGLNIPNFGSTPKMNPVHQGGFTAPKNMESHSFGKSNQYMRMRAPASLGMQTSNSSMMMSQTNFGSSGPVISHLSSARGFMNSNATPRSSVVMMASPTVVESDTKMTTKEDHMDSVVAGKWTKGDAAPVMIGIAADSGCGKSTFMKRIVKTLGAEITDAHTPQGDLMTVICLDDYHLNDRQGRKDSGRTALHPEEQLFDLMAEHTKKIKNGEQVMKPIYNHDTGLKDPEEPVDPNHIVVLEGLHPMYDERVKNLLDFSIYVDISDEVKFAWKLQRDMEERGWTKEEVLASIEQRKPDFSAYIDPQKKNADMVLQVLPTKLTDDPKAAGKLLRVRLIQKEGNDLYNPYYLIDEGGEVAWTPSQEKLSTDKPGVKFSYYKEDWYGQQVSVLECDGEFKDIEELLSVEKVIGNLPVSEVGELTTQMKKLEGAPGSLNGTGLL